MSDNKTRAFNLLPRLADARDFSAKDLEVRGNFSWPRDILVDLRRGGQVERSFRLGREQFYKPVQTAPKPIDKREDPARITAAALKRKRRSIIARARAIRHAKRLAKKAGK